MVPEVAPNLRGRLPYEKSAVFFPAECPRSPFLRNVRSLLSCRIFAGPHCVMSAFRSLSSQPGVAYGLTALWLARFPLPGFLFVLL